MYDKNHYNKVISLQLIKINEKKITKQHRNRFFCFFFFPLIQGCAASWGDPGTAVATCTEEGMPAKGCSAERRK